MPNIQLVTWWLFNINISNCLKGTSIPAMQSNGPVNPPSLLFDIWSKYESFVYFITYFKFVYEFAVHSLLCVD